ncbi:hypothetical protein B0T16DRAFT_490373 [Cercophora newfieldiana]|uniref:Uncharacterized protein n=1 Tax=Cercophora newfieldiana TaxID=92897 RepID=A0AA39YJA7_9PEZI|nr:hypothetical protein B0T16DRAFT_490373 [Cercophora newfieldiana]
MSVANSLAQLLKYQHQRADAGHQRQILDQLLRMSAKQSTLDLRDDAPITKAEALEELSVYQIFRFEETPDEDDDSFDYNQLDGSLRWVRVTYHQVPVISREAISREIRKLDRETGSVAEKKATLTSNQLRHIESVLEEQRRRFDIQSFETNLVQLDRPLACTKNGTSKRDKLPSKRAKGGRQRSVRFRQRHANHGKPQHSTPKPTNERPILAYFKTSPRLTVDPIKLYYETRAKSREQKVQESLRPSAAPPPPPPLLVPGGTQLPPESPKNSSKEYRPSSSSSSSFFGSTSDVYRSGETISSNPTSHDLGPILMGKRPERDERDTETERPDSLTFLSYIRQPRVTDDNELTDDLESLASVQDDISSLTGSDTLAAVEYLAKEFTEDKELLSLYQDAVNKTTNSRFIRNHRRLLKRYFLDLADAAKTSQQKLAIRFLRRRGERTSISAAVWHFVQPSEATLKEKLSMMLENEKDNLFLLDRLLSGHKGVSELGHGEDSEIDWASSDGDDTDDDESFFRGLSNVTSATAFLTTGHPYEAYKEHLRNFLQQNPTDSQEIDAQRVIEGRTVSLAFGGHPTSLLRRLAHRAREWMRPRIKDGYKRIEWTCDCGVELYGDFLYDDKDAFTELANALQTGSYPQSNKSAASSPPTAPTAPAGPSQSIPQQNQAAAPPNASASRTITATQSPPQQPSTSSSPAQHTVQQTSPPTPPKFLALCVDSGGIYKTLTEIDVSQTRSDAEAFLQIKRAYLNSRSLRSRLNILLKPVTVEFVRFTLWYLRHGYISIFDRPLCIPPQSQPNYEYLPRPLLPLPPVPPEIFLHYLSHGEGDMNPSRHVWLPRLPKRLDKGVVQSGDAADGWGIHIVEGPNRVVIFWILIVTMLAGVVVAGVWSGLKDDVQGGSGLGAFMVALPTAVMAAFLFRLGGT